MNERILRSLKFSLERWIQRGVAQQLLLMSGFVALVAVVGGIAAWAATSGFASPLEAIWWSFLRLTDPGYLGDDEGVTLRVISTAVTVLGYVLFMGSLIAILTQWLEKTLRRLESGLTPINMKHHVILLGWTNRTPETVLKLLSGQGRLQRFLDRSDIRKLRIVVLAAEVDADLRMELRHHLGAFWDEGQVFLRSGSSQQEDDLERLDLLRASVIVVPGADFELGGAEMTDTRVIKTLLTIHQLLRASNGKPPPRVVAEIFDPHKAILARETLESPVEVIASDRVISCLISQSIRHRGLASLLVGILSHREGNSIYLRDFPEFAGRSAQSLREAFPRAIVMGFVRSENGVLTPHLDPNPAARLERDDLLVLLAESYQDCRPLADPPSAPDVSHQPSGESNERVKTERILILGWSLKIAPLIVELDEAHSGLFEITVLSRVPIEERVDWLARRGSGSRPRVQVEHVLGDYSLERELSAVRPGERDHILFLASGWLESSEAADARTILGYVLLRSLLRAHENRPQVIVELVDKDSSRLLDSGEDTLLVSPRLLSHLLAHVALRPELNPVFDHLFGVGGAEIQLRSAREFGLAGQDLAFARIQTAALEHGVVALGISTRHAGSPHLDLNPDRGRSWSMQGDDRIIVLASEDQILRDLRSHPS